MGAEIQADVAGAGSFGAGSSQLARPANIRATISDLARIVDQQHAELQGIKYWLLQKAAYDCIVNEVLGVRLDQISLHYSVDPSTFPLMPPFPEELSRL